MLSIIQTYLSETRAQHSINVADTAQQLAIIHGEDKNLAYQAGLFHDIAKEQTPASLIEKGVAPINIQQDIYDSFPKIWHALVAPELIKILLENPSPAILNAVKWHTTGKANMSQLEQIIYIADFIEPDRRHPLVAYISDLAKQNLDIGTYATVYSCMKHLDQKNSPLYTSTSECETHYRNKLDYKMLNTIRKTIAEKEISR